MTELNLSYGEITDVSPLAGLMLLKKLNLVGNKRNVSVCFKHFTGGRGHPPAGRCVAGAH